MKREEAIRLLQEIVARCRTIDYNQILLKSPGEKASADSEGFELHVKNHPSEADQKCLKGIVQTRNLSMRESNGWLVFYRPKQPV